MAKPTKELYVINFIESGEVLTPESFHEYWKNYGNAQGSGLYGWRAPKKIYFSLGQAKSGFSHVPAQLKPLLEISKFTRLERVISGEDLLETQEKSKKEKKLKEEARIKRLRLERAMKELELATEQMGRFLGLQIKEKEN